jgi:hypothetical protein
VAQHNQTAEATRSEATSKAVIPAENVERVRKYAAIRRGQCAEYDTRGDRTRNGENFAFRIGMECDDALETVRSLGIAETEYSLLTGLPPGSLRWMSVCIKRGVEARKVRS